MKAILLDIEGTTTSISFVHDVLFPYSKKQMAKFLESNLQDPNVEAYINQVLTDPDQGINNPGDWQTAYRILLNWIENDVKKTPLKALQGMIWKDGYRSGAFKSHVYADVPDKFKEWASQNICIAIYSSGSIDAQKLLFKHTELGDLTNYIDFYFDTTTGPKKDSNSYLKISNSLSIQPNEILFLSDVEAELDAAAAVGIKTTQILRPGIAPSKIHPQKTNFTEIVI